MKELLRKIGWVRRADDFTDTRPGYWVGLALGAVLWVLVLYVVADVVNSRQEVIYYRQLLKGHSHP